jgi:hypothetical protein
MSGTNFISTLGLTSGMNTIDITATNLAGKSSSAKRTVTSNSTAPTLSITTPDQDMSTKEANITISGTVTETLTSATISITADGQTYTPTVATNGSFSQTINLTTDKTYAIVITATDQANNKATVQRNIIKSTKAKVFLGTGDNFTVSTSGTTLYGGTGNGAVTIKDVVTGVILDQNIGQINLQGRSNDYTFKQTGNMINVYDTTGTTLIVRAPVQGDADGTQISFSNGTASASAKLSGGIMTLGGKMVSTATATILDPTTIATTLTQATTKAKVFLSADESFTVSSSGTTLHGNTGKGIVTISGGSTDVTLDQNIERINLPGTPGTYKFRQTGNLINVYDVTSGNLIVKTPVQGDTDGTVLGFSGGTASVLLSGGVMKLGGATVSPGAASVIEPVLK